MTEAEMKYQIDKLQKVIEHQQIKRTGKVSLVRDAKKQIYNLQHQLKLIAMENIIKTVSQSAEFVPLKVSVHADHLKRIHALAEEFNLSLDEIATALFYERMEKAGKQWKH